MKDLKKEMTEEEQKKLAEEIVKIIDEENDCIDDVFGKNVAGIQLPDPNNYLYFKKKRHRYLYLYDDIDESTISIANWIIQWNLEDERNNITINDRLPIKILFNSPGGYLDIAFTIADTISMSKTPIIGINIGECCSAAALIYACCPIRLAFPHSYFLLHLGSGGTGGTYQQSKAQMRNWSVKIQQMKKMLIKHLGLEDCDNFEDLIEEEWFLYTDDDSVEEKYQAKKYNLFTDICRNFNWEI